MYLTMFAVLVAVVGHTDCHHSDSAKHISEPLHIHALAVSCNSAYDKVYCLNGGRCFNVTVATYSFPSCECATGFMGERCDRKYLDRSYNPEDYKKTDDTITSKHWSNTDKSRETFNNVAGEIYVGSAAAKRISVTQSPIFLLHLLIFVIAV